MMHRTAISFGALLVGSVSSLSAQTALYTSVGQRVRLRTGAASQWLVGTLIAADRDSVQLQVSENARPVSIAWQTVSRFEVRRGGHSNARKGALIGLGLGAIGGGVWGLADASNCTGWLCLSPGQEALGGALLLGGAGALVGAAIGSLSRTDRWEPLSIGRAHVTLMPGRAATGLSIGLRF